MALALDGTPAKLVGSTTSGTTPQVGALSTTYGYGKAFVFALLNFSAPNAALTTSITDTSGLTWSLVARDHLPADTHYWGTLWSADIGATPLSGVTVTMNLSASADYATLSAFCVSNGGNVNGLAFDSGGPQTASGAGDPGAEASMTTATAAALIIGCARTNNTGPGPGTGWTGIMANETGAFSMTEYQVASSTGTFTQTPSIGGQQVSLICAVIAGLASAGGPLMAGGELLRGGSLLHSRIAPRSAPTALWTPAPKRLLKPAHRTLRLAA